MTQIKETVNKVHQIIIKKLKINALQIHMKQIYRVYGMYCYFIFRI